MIETVEHLTEGANMSCGDKTLDFVEDQIKTIVRHVGLSGLATGLNNAFCHGEIFDEVGTPLSEKQLDDVYKCVNRLSKIADKID
jgi:hypothetical protein